METYNNDYTKQEDFMMWEIHQVRNEVWKEIKDKKTDEINKNAHDIINKWKNKLNKKVVC